MRVRVNLMEEVFEVYEVEFDGDMEDFDPIEHCIERNLVSRETIDSRYQFNKIKQKENHEH